jgi:hypothetical protein
LSWLILVSIGSTLFLLARRDGLSAPLSFALAASPALCGNFMWLALIGMEHAMVPALAAYMGLVGLSSTERYLRLTPERFRHQLNLLSPKRGRRRWGDNPDLMRFLAHL